MVALLTTGCERLDELLSGGLPIGHISHIYGPAGTGKTTFALQCSANLALNGWKIIFVDTENSFSVERLEQISGDAFQSVMKKIILFRLSSFVEQSELIDILDEITDKEVRLIIFDTITGLYRTELLKHRNTHILQHELNRQLAFLFNISRQKNISVLLINQVKAVFDEENLEAVASNIVNWWASVVIRFIREEGIKRKAEIIKHYKKPIGTSVTFSIVSSGLV